MSAHSSWPATLILWDVANGTPIRRLAIPGGDAGPRVAFQADGNILAAGNDLSVVPVSMRALRMTGTRRTPAAEAR